MVMTDKPDEPHVYTWSKVWDAYLERVRQGPFRLSWGFWLTVIPATVAVLNLPREWQLISGMVVGAAFLVALALLSVYGRRSRQAVDLNLGEHHRDQ